MGHKKVCINCRESLNLDISDYSSETYPCSKCGRQMTLLPHRFRPPKKSNNKGWELVEFLISNGFPFQHIYQIESNECHKKLSYNYVSYPKNLLDAKEFIIKYKKQSKNK